MRRVKGIDGYRGLAALMIALYHVWGSRGAFTKGYLAVDFFFIVSGFFLFYSKTEKINSGYDYMKKATYRFFPKIFCIYTTLILFQYAIGNWSKDVICQRAINYVYEILGFHILGISSEYYIYSAIWFIPVLIFISMLYISMDKINSKAFITVILPLIILGAYTYLFSIYGNLADFRDIHEGSLFIKGVWRGMAGLGVGILLSYGRHYLKNIVRAIRPITIGLLEIVNVVILLLIMFLPPEKSSDILIVPCSCVLIILCYAERGIGHYVMEAYPFKKLGQISEEIYLSHIFALIFTRLVGELVFGTTALEHFNLGVTVILLSTTIFFAILFKWLIIPLEIAGIKKILFRKNK